ncbi:TBC1 domain family member 16 [Culex quinquefasciatus]|uniref:TBC1 domain family member 16 n=1 Tax=Culex quinquefasciatus TaxID=7176 RepID=B0WN44_CULQU|nr:TBC1 domain family member 16 [Culex quinquefasciatus]|eukprot:XP_001850128.1 TBC1 domain family member 16 [Culex quinquefasciatus]
MPIVSILKRASSYIMGSDEDGDEGNNEMVYEDNEVLFCKNNICVHPPAVIRQESDVLHYPGYLTVTTKTFIDQYNNAKRPTLFLTWIPNSTLRKCPSTVENVGFFRCNSLSENKLKLHQQHEQLKLQQKEQLQKGEGLAGHSVPEKPGENPFVTTIKIANTNPFLEPYNDTLAQTSSDAKSMNCSDYSETISISSSSDKASLCNSNEYSREDVHDDEEDEGIITSETNMSTSIVEESTEEQELKTELQPLIETEESAKAASSAKVLPSQTSVTSVNITIASPHIQNVDIPPPDAVLPPNERFMRSLSVSSSDENNPNWMSPELLAYKHNLAFPESASASPIVNRKTPLKCRRFSVDLSQMRALRLFFNDENCTSGQLVIASRESQYKILHFHHGGLDHLAQVLHQWHCLLHNIKLAPVSEKSEIKPRWRRRMAQAQFWRTVQCVIEKDVVRTDRGNPFFAGEDNPNIDTMKNILLNYAFYNPGMSYTQGMSDLLAPVLCEIKNESETFWCFVGLMQRAIFVCTPTDNDIDRNLCYLRELIRLMVPSFYKHLQKHTDAMELLFCHRWILLCFKREFTEAVAIRMWEACWSNYLTDYFHLFLCLAIIAVYADDVIAQDLRTDEMLLHFSSLGECGLDFS